MSVTLSAAYLAELAKNVHTPCVIFEVELDSGTVKWGTHKPFSDVLPLIGKTTSYQNKIDTKAGYSTRGQITFTIVGRDNFKPIIRDEFLKNRRVTRMEGFVASGFQYADYAATYTGKIVDWSRKGDELTIYVQDDLVDATQKIPVELDTKTQSLNLQNMNPVDMITNILLTQLGMDAALVDSAQFESERDTWLNGWKFERVLTEPTPANDIINALQIETDSYVIHDGEKVSFKVFAPPVPGQAIEEYTDGKDIILNNSFSCKPGYKDAFFNRIVVYFDYDESGSDGESNFEAAVIAVDADSQGAAEWDETSTKVIKSKYIRSKTYSQPTNTTGVVIYHMSKGNAVGSGTLAYNATNKTLTWTPPGGSAGTAVNISQDGKYQIFGADETMYIRVVVTYDDLAGTDKTDTITVTALNGEVLATVLASKLLSRFRDPAASVTFTVDKRKAGYGGVLIKPTDYKDLTTDEACEKGASSWSAERVVLTAIKPDDEKGVLHLEAIEARMYRHYCFIAPSSTPDYGSASDYEKRYYGFIGDSNNMVGAGTVDGYYIW